jgi:hypothetical protein
MKRGRAGGGARWEGERRAREEVGGARGGEGGNDRIRKEGSDIRGSRKRRQRREQMKLLRLFLNITEPFRYEGVGLVDNLNDNDEMQYRSAHIFVGFEWS